jgi:hypothetical protein
MVRSLLAEREGEKQRAQEQTRREEALQRRADDLHLELLRAQLEVERYKKWYYVSRERIVFRAPAIWRNCC